MSTLLKDSQAFAMFNDTYQQAKQARGLAEYLENTPNDTPQAKKWHLIADRLFEAVELFDTMATQSNAR